MMRRVSTLVIAVVVSACGGDSPPVPKTITITPTEVLFDAIGLTDTLRATVTDERGRAFDGATVTWSISGTGAALGVAPASATGIPTHVARIISTNEGEVVVTATAGTATTTLHIVIDQIPVGIVKISGDNQVGAVNAALPQLLSVRVVDRLKVPLTDRAVTFQVVDGGGSVSSSLVQPASDGTASIIWTLGTETTEHVSASVAGAPFSPATFAATAVAGGVTGLLAAMGGNEAIMAGADATPPQVQAVNGAGVGVPGLTVSFAVTAGGGTINTTSAVTDANGVASLAKWTMGPVGAPNTVTATIIGLDPLAFTNAACDNDTGPNFGIVLCYRTEMTASQRGAFVGAAARWKSIITSDLADVTAVDGFTGACGSTVPLYKGTVDDLLIFVSIENIDGPSNIVGEAGPCIGRTPGLLTVIGTMHFDEADMFTLESRGLLDAVILHEMGHVLGIGTLWSRKGLLQNPSTTSSSVDTYFSGVNGIAGFDAIGGTAYVGGNKVPVENTGGAGTINGHWRQSLLRNELMTGTIDNGANPLSVLTVRSLEDLGYTVNALNADSFFLTLAAQLPGAVTGGVSLEGDILNFPLMTVDTKGRMNRVPH